MIQTIKKAWETKNGKILIGIVAVVILCFSVICIAGIISPSKPTAPAGPTVDVQASAVAQAWKSVTETSIASWTATPSKTPIPTNTPFPTVTSTPEHVPFTLTGSGDSIVDVPKWNGPAIMHAKYSSGGNFAVINYGANNEYIDLLINETYAYEGTVPIDFLDNEHTVRFEVKASGPWEFLISPIASARMFKLPAVITGTGDDIVIIGGENADVIKADNSQGNSNFAVIAYGESYGRDLIFNEIAPYTGSALLKSDTVILTITAAGPWSLDISTK